MRNSLRILVYWGKKSGVIISDSIDGIEYRSLSQVFVDNWLIYFIFYHALVSTDRNSGLNISSRIGNVGI